MPVPTDRAEVVAAAEAAVRDGSAPVMLPASPLMHGTGFFFSLGNLLRGGCVVTLPAASPGPGRALVGGAGAPRGGAGDRGRRVRRSAARRAGPRAAADGEPYDLTALRRVVSSGVRWSPENKRRLLRAGRFTLQDSIASTEGGPYGVSLAGPDPDSVPAEFTLPPNAPGARPGRDRRGPRLRAGRRAGQHRLPAARLPRRPEPHRRGVPDHRRGPVRRARGRGHASRPTARSRLLGRGSG